MGQKLPISLYVEEIKMSVTIMDIFEQGDSLMYSVEYDDELVKSLGITQEDVELAIEKKMNTLINSYLECIAEDKVEG